jgi:hypothetical protein
MGPARRATSTPVLAPCHKRHVCALVHEEAIVDDDAVAGGDRKQRFARGGQPERTVLHIDESLGDEPVETSAQLLMEGDRVVDRVSSRDQVRESNPLCLAAPESNGEEHPSVDLFVAHLPMVGAAPMPVLSGLPAGRLSSPWIGPARRHADSVRAAGRGF